MGYAPASFRGFGGGLNLRDAPDVVDERYAIDCLNVVFSERGAVQQRDGSRRFTSATLTNSPDSMAPFYKTNGTKALVVGNGNRLDVLNTFGASVANALPTANPHFFTRFGGPTAEVMYIANGTDQVRKLAEAAGVFTFSTPAGLSSQTGKFLAVTPTSNRLMVARESGATGGNNPSSVNFSDPGAPETFGATNWVDLDPGDGEEIMGIVAWREYVFVFKQTKFWVFYGESTDSTGGPVFNFRKVNTGLGLAAPRALTAGREGVYFLDRTGIYRTTGGNPELLSDVIDPFFAGDPSVYFSSSTLNHDDIAAATAAWHEEQVYFAMPTGSSATNNRMLVYDPRHNWWSIWAMFAPTPGIVEPSALVSFQVGDRPDLLFGDAKVGDEHIYRFKAGDLKDGMTTTGTGGDSIQSKWVSGWQDYGSPDVKTIRESKLWGTGTMTVGIRRDFRFTPDQSEQVTLSSTADTWGDGTGSDTWGGGDPSDLWGPAGVLGTAMMRSAVRGTVFSTEFSNPGGAAWSVHRLTHELRGKRIPGTTKTEVN